MGETRETELSYRPLQQPPNWLLFHSCSFSNSFFSRKSQRDCLKTWIMSLHCLHSFSDFPLCLEQNVNFQPVSLWRVCRIWLLPSPQATLPSSLHSSQLACLYSLVAPRCFLSLAAPSPWKSPLSPLHCWLLHVLYSDVSLNSASSKRPSQPSWSQLDPPLFTLTAFPQFIIIYL